MRAASAEACGAWSIPLCCRTALGPPATPSPPVVLAKTSTTVHIRWGGEGGGGGEGLEWTLAVDHGKRSNIRLGLELGLGLGLGVTHIPRWG